MKIKSKLKKVGVSLSSAIMLFATKVMAMDDIAQPMYGIKEPEAEPQAIPNVLKIIGILLIPIILLIGAKIYISKGRNDEDKRERKKGLLKGVVVAIAILIALVVGVILNEVILEILY